MHTVNFVELKSKRISRERISLQQLIGFFHVCHLKVFFMSNFFCSLTHTQSGLTDSYCKLPMALTAENLAEKFDIKRDAVDAFALQSQQRWGAAHAAGVFKTEIVPVELKVKGKDVTFEVDEHPK